MTLFANISHPGCYNFNETFSEEPSCNPSFPDCGSDFVARDPSRYDPAANYSNVEFFQSRLQTDDVDPTELVLRTYESGDCNESTGSFSQWTGCDRESTGCTELPFSVGSLYIDTVMETRRLSRRVDACQVGALRGTATRGEPLQRGAIVLAAISAWILLGAL